MRFSVLTLLMHNPEKRPESILCLPPHTLPVGIASCVVVTAGKAMRYSARGSQLRFPETRLARNQLHVAIRLPYSFWKARACTYQPSLFSALPTHLLSIERSCVKTRILHLWSRQGGLHRVSIIFDAPWLPNDCLHALSSGLFQIREKGVFGRDLSQFSQLLHTKRLLARTSS